MCFFIIACSYFDSIHATTAIFYDSTNLVAAADQWCYEESKAKEFYGDISTWDVSRVTDMERLFDSCTSTTLSIDNWNTSNVVTMRMMFLNAEFFDRDIGGK